MNSTAILNQLSIKFPTIQVYFIQENIYRYISYLINFYNFDFIIKIWISLGQIYHCSKITCFIVFTNIFPYISIEDKPIVTNCFNVSALFIINLQYKISLLIMRFT